MGELAVVLVTYRRIDLLKIALHSLSQAVQGLHVQQNRFVVKTYLCVNGSDEESLSVVLAAKQQNPNLHLHIEHLRKPLTPAGARNHLLKMVSSPYVFFMDDDVQLPPQIFIHFLQLYQLDPAIDIWGGPNLTPIGSTSRKLDNGWFLVQPLIVGPIAMRYGFSKKKIQRGSQFNLMLCNLFIRREAMGQQAFKVFFKTAEENELIYRLEKQGCKMASSDLLFVWHERRQNYKDFLKQIFCYGYGRGQLFCRVSVKRQKLFIAVPVFISLALISWTKTLWIFLLWLIILKTLYITQLKRFNILAMFVPLMMWFCYSTGLLLGLASMRKNLLKSNHTHIYES